MMIVMILWVIFNEFGMLINSAMWIVVYCTVSWDAQLFGLFGLASMSWNYARLYYDARWCMLHANMAWNVLACEWMQWIRYNFNMVWSVS